MARVAVGKKHASQSGEQQLIVKLGTREASGGNEVPYICEIRFNKDLYDSLSAGEKTAIEGVFSTNLKNLIVTGTYESFTEL